MSLRIARTLPCALAAATLAALAVLPATGADDAPAVESLISTERAFAKTSVEKGMKEAFLAYLAPDAVIFRPGPVNGHEWIGARPDPGVKLEWEPAFADVSSGGDLGYTTGPWTVTGKREGNEVHSYGQFVSLWKKHTDGTWRVALDHGITHPNPGAAVTKVATPPAADASFESPGGKSPSLDQMERDLDATARESGVTAAYRSILDPDVRLYREGGAVVLGAMGAQRWIASHPGHAQHSPAGTIMAKTGDLACTWGTLTFRPDTVEEDHVGSYVRIWKKNPSGSWSIVVDIVTPNE